MPRVKSAAAAAAAQQLGFGAHQAADALGGLALSDAGCSSSGSAAEAAADAFAAGRTFRAYGHDNRVFDLEFHPASSSLLVSASDDCSAGVWRRQQGGTAAGGRYIQVAAFQGHADSVMRVAWSPEGSMVASGSSDGVVCLWRPEEAALSAKRNLGHAGTRELARLEGHPEECYACLWLQPSSSSSSGNSSGDGGASLGGSAAQQRLVVASGESLYLWDVATQQQLCTAGPPPAPVGAAGSEHEVPERWRPGYLFGVAAQPDGPLIGAACSDGWLRLWTREGGDSALAPLCTLPWNQAMGSDCVFGRSGLFCAVSKDGSVVMMDVRQGRCLQHLQVDAPLMSCQLLGEAGRGGGQCLVAAGADGGVHFIDCTSGDVTSLFPEAAPPRPLLCACLSADGASLAASGEAVVLGEDDLAGSEQPGPPASGGHQPLRKWSPIHVWQRQGAGPA